MHPRKRKQYDAEYDYSEAYRYLQNARETLHKSDIDYGTVYHDSKYVREAAGIAYLAALKAIDSYLLRKGVKVDDLPDSIEEYRLLINKKIPLNGKLMAALKVAYENLHLLAYYRGGTSVGMIKAGFDNCRKIIDMLAKTK